MKKSLKSYKKLRKAVEKYASNRGIGNQPLIELNRAKRIDVRQWMGNAVMAAYFPSDGSIEMPSKNSTYCSGTFWTTAYAKEAYVFIQVQDIFPDLDPAAFWGYIEWVVNESPWASAFITKNINTIKRRRVLVIKPRLDKWFIKEAAIAVRQPWENYYNNGYYKQIGLWWELSQQVDKRIAFIAARTMSKVSDGLVQMKSSDEGHTPLNLTLSSPVTYGRFSGWIRGRKYKGKWDDRKPRKVIDTIAKVIREGPSDQKRGVNPFPGAVADFPRIRRDKFIERVAGGAKEIEEAING